MTDALRLCAWAALAVPLAAAVLLFLYAAAQLTTFGKLHAVARWRQEQRRRRLARAANKSLRDRYRDN